jgi:hypothetical protein
MRTNWCRAEKAQHRVFADRDMASQSGVVAEDYVISELTIMSHMTTKQLPMPLSH